MREILQWTTLAVCAAATLARIPSALRGTNRSLFFIFLLATAAGVLSLEVFYLPIDRVLGGINIASLLLRLIVFAAIYLVAFRVSRAFGAKDAYSLISGRTGLGVLGLFSAALVTLFLLMDFSASSTGLADTGGRSHRNASLLPYYWATARGYPTYVSLALLPSLVRTLVHSRDRIWQVGQPFLGPRHGNAGSFRPGLAVGCPSGSACESTLPPPDSPRSLTISPGFNGR